MHVYVRGNLEQPNISPLSLGPFASRGYHRSCWRNAVRSESINSKVSNVRPFRAPRNRRWKTGDDSSGGVGCFRGFRTSKRSHTSEHGFIEVYICPNLGGEYICGIPFWYVLMSTGMASMGGWKAWMTCAVGQQCKWTTSKLLDIW